VIILKRNDIRCPNCGAKATLRPTSVVYGEADKTDGFLYVCDRYPKCDSYVGAHRKTLEPMGTLADGNLRHKRILAHKSFDRLWKSGLMTKWQAYKWMQAKFGLSSEQAHIAKFSDFMCDQLIAMCDRIKLFQSIAA
jgi:ssDNA-binding Zn-finger/Zn-ribbon topoisomerase 1